jgi:uncharacterized repeat protein (TIGR03803 family)
MANSRAHILCLGITGWSRLTACAVTLMVIILAPNPALGQTYTVIHNFTGGPGGGQTPYAGVVLDRAGDLYGTTAAGGGGSCSSNFGTGCGIVYELKPSSGLFTTLWQFTGGSDGATPGAGLILGPGATLYGSTTAGGGGNCSGQDGCGTVFQLSPP